MALTLFTSLLALSRLPTSLALAPQQQPAVGSEYEQQILGSNDEVVGSNWGVPGQPASYDYIIIGGGTAGLAIASRLATTHSVAVIEAGGLYETDNGNRSVIPSYGIFYTGSDPKDTQPLVDWDFVTAPQAGLDNREMHYARGKCLGGSSGRHFLAYTRGTRGSYGMWADEVGDPTYTYDSFLPYFQKSVQFTPGNDQLRGNTSAGFNPKSFAANGGPVQVTYPNWGNIFSTILKSAMNFAGLNNATDFVSGELDGAEFAMVTLNPDDQTRSSSESSYMRQAINRTPLQIYGHTQAKKILFTGTKATGVLVESGGTQYPLSANNEVIVSAGTFQSPQMLMVSGVGPRQTLEKFDIPVVSDLEGVGQNMWDHVLFGPSYAVSVPTHSSVGNPAWLAQATKDYLSPAHTGPLTNNGGDFIGFEKLSNDTMSKFTRNTQEALSIFPSDWPEVEYLAFDAYVGRSRNYILDAPRDGKQYGGAAAAIVSPISRGNVTISSSDNADLPIINPNWLTDPADQELALSSFKRVRDFMSAPVMNGVIVGDEAYPGKNVTSDEDIMAAIRDSAQTVWHAAATCKMGKVGDKMAVVDSQARVMGTQGLRVVDASAFPFLPPGHPQSTIYALAEKIADDILGTK